MFSEPVKYYLEIAADKQKYRNIALHTIIHTIIVLVSVERPHRELF